MSTPFWVLGLMMCSALASASLTDFAGIERDSSTASFVAEGEAARLRADWDSMSSWADLEAWLAEEPHSGVAALDWCAVPPSGAGEDLAVILTYEVDGSADRRVLRSDANGAGSALAVLPAPRGWAPGWTALAGARACA